MKKSICMLLLLATAVVSKTDKQEKEFSLNFFQNDYQVKFERVELVRYNKDYGDISIVTFKYNRTQAVCNITYGLNVDVGNDLEWIVQGYKFMSNEYRLFPIHFGVNLCKAIAANAAGARQVFKCGNFTGCPILKGKRYHVCNFYPDQSKLPPLIPNGDYKLEIQAMHLSNEVYVIYVYGSITRPISFGK